MEITVLFLLIVASGELGVQCNMMQCGQTLPSVKEHSVKLKLACSKVAVHNDTHR